MPESTVESKILVRICFISSWDINVTLFNILKLRIFLQKKNISQHSQISLNIMEYFHIEYLRKSNINSP